MFTSQNQHPLAQVPFNQLGQQMALFSPMNSPQLTPMNSSMSPNPYQTSFNLNLAAQQPFYQNQTQHQTQAQNQSMFSLQNANFNLAQSFPTQIIYQQPATLQLNQTSQQINNFQQNTNNLNQCFNYQNQFSQDSSTSFDKSHIKVESDLQQQLNFLQQKQNQQQLQLITTQRKESYQSYKTSDFSKTADTLDSKSLQNRDIFNQVKSVIVPITPDRQNEWIMQYYDNDMIKSILPTTVFQDCHEYFKLKNSSEKLNLKFKFLSREQFQQKSQRLHEKKRSKFHNKNKLFFISIIKIFKKKQVEKLNLPGQLYNKFFALVHSCRLSGRKMVEGKVNKTDLFNHSHYNLLFLTLNEDSMKEISKNEQDYKIHLKTFGIDIKERKIAKSKSVKTAQITSSDFNSDDYTDKKLSYRTDELYYQGEHASDEQEFQKHIQYINFLKTCVYQVVIFHLKEIMIGNSDQQNEEREYDYRAFKALLEMVKGNCKDRF